MYRTACRMLLGAALLLLCTALRGQDRVLLGTFHSPKGVGASAIFWSPNGAEMDILTLRTDFYGVLAGRTRDVGALLAYSHDYVLWDHAGPDYRLRLHVGAGGQLGYVHDFERGFFSATERRLLHGAGAMASVSGNAGVCVDFSRRLTLDVSFSVAPGVHLRVDRPTGAVLVSFYQCGVYHAYIPQVNLMYRF